MTKRFHCTVSNPAPPPGKKWYRKPSVFGDYRDMENCGFMCGLMLAYDRCCKTCKRKLDGA